MWRKKDNRDTGLKSAHILQIIWNSQRSFKKRESEHLLGNPVMIWLQPPFWWSCVRVQRFPSRCDGNIKWRTVSPLELLWRISDLCSLRQDQFPVTSESKLRPKKVIVWLSSTTFLELVRADFFLLLQIKVKATQNFSLHLPIKGQKSCLCKKKKIYLGLTSFKPVIRFKQVDNNSF